MVPFHGQGNVKNVLALDIYIHWQTRGCGTSLGAKKTLVSSGLVIGMPTYLSLGQATQLSYVIILFNCVFKKLFILRWGR
jgi:hypothetical protein